MRTKTVSFLTMMFLAGSAAAADTHIAPVNAATTGGTGAYTTILHAQARSYQLVIGPAHLPNVPPGMAARITGIQWRMASWQAYAPWPPASVTFQNFDITLSTSLNAAGSLSTVYTENIGPDAVQVRSGALTFIANSFPGGAVTPAFNAWGPLVPFANHYDYLGGNLLLTIRHTGTGSSSGGLDWVGGANCQAIGVSSYTQPDQWYAQGNNGAIACQLTYTLVPAASPCYPNCDGSTGSPLLTANDFQCFLNKYAQADTYANCDGSTGSPLLTANDFQCFLNKYAVGCS
ncbi:MAG: hypothetical protein KF678_09650 [Phycisphaeraceae bacterium]|nr:hypothetical protein [Phycisphaeraceae bacterium]